jgi:uncharacterized protein (DUF983 family)
VRFFAISGGIQAQRKTLMPMDTVPPIAAETIVWQPGRAPEAPARPVPGMVTALRRGFTCACPACGQGRLFQGYLRVVEACGNCGARLGEYRADDAPPYFTIFLVGHIVVPGMFLLSRHSDLPDMVQGAIWVPITAALALALLRPIKGATVGLMLRLGMTRAGQDG